MLKHEVVEIGEKWWKEDRANGVGAGLCFGFQLSSFLSPHHLCQLKPEFLNPREAMLADVAMEPAIPAISDQCVSMQYGSVRILIPNKPGISFSFSEV